MTKPELWPHQKKSLNKYRNTPKVFDMSDPGTGKTRAAIEAFAERGGRALIIAPKSLLEAAWAEDIKKFAPQLSYSIAYASNREAAFSVAADVYITNTDAAKWLGKQNKDFFSSFTTLIIDESSYFKHHTSQRSKSMRKIAKHFEYRALLTGTPTSRSITDIWHQALILDDGARLGTSFYKFREVVCRPEMKGQYTEWKDRPEARQSVAQILQDVTIRHEFYKVMPHVPENVEHFVKYKPSAKLMEQYRKLRDEALLMLKDGAISAVNAAVLRGKLLQLASGSVYGENGKSHVIDSGRTDLVLDLIEQRQHSITFYNWDHQREALVRGLTKRKISFAEITRNTKGADRGRIVKEYQDGQYQTLIMHPQTGAHGLTLTRGTATIWCSPNDRADLIVQGKHRVLRGVQDKETENVMVCAENTLEQGVYQRTEGKRNAMTELMELLQ